MILQYLQEGMDRIEFRNQLLELIIGNTPNGDEVKLKDFKLNDIILYLKEQIKEMEQEIMYE
jgi:hypothetical protein